MTPRITILSALVALLATIAGTAQAGLKYVGGDISLLPSYEDHGATFYDTDGTTAITDLLSYFASQDLNAMRVRLFVNPDNASDDDKGDGAIQDLEYVTTLGKRIKDAGFAFLLDLHYSDSWADPSHQYTPADWSALGDDDLVARISDYTKATLQTLINAGATPDYIQIGNEISYGMLWGVSGGTLKKCYTSSTSNWQRFANLLSSASKACREACPDAKIIIHTERVAQTSVLKAFYQNMASYNVDYDIIGLSYYPIYHNGLDQLSAAITTLETTFTNKPIWLVEVGYWHAWQPSSTTYDISSTYPVSEAGQQAFTEALIDTLNNHSSVTGLFWWHMEANEHGLDWSTKRVTDEWWNASLFDNSTGKALGAITVLRNFLTDDATAIHNAAAPSPQPAQANAPIYTLDGKALGTDPSRLKAGIYVRNNKKIIVQ